LLGGEDEELAARQARRDMRAAILARKSSTDRLQGLEANVDELSRAMAAIMVVLEAKGFLTADDVRSVLRDASLYDENDDGRLTLADMAERIPELHSQATDSQPRAKSRRSPRRKPTR
jgi:hypothetical protein